MIKKDKGEILLFFEFFIECLEVKICLDNCISSCFLFVEVILFFVLV